MSCSPRIPRATYNAVQILVPEIEQILADLPVNFPPVETLVEDAIDDEATAQFSAPEASSSTPAAVSQTSSSTSGTSKRSSKRPRKSRERDNRNGRTMQRIDPRTTATGSSALVATPLYTSSITIKASKKQQTKRQRANQRDNRLLPAWRYTGDLTRMKAMARSVEEFGVYAFSLNLSSEVAAKAIASPKKAKTFLADRLTKALRRHFSYQVEFAFFLEFTPGGRLHIHGIVGVDPSHKKFAKKALAEAGGQWDATHPEFQADARKLWFGDGWANYCDKACSRTKKTLGLDDNASILSATQNLRRLGEAYWENLRKTEKRERAARHATSLTVS